MSFGEATGRKSKSKTKGKLKPATIGEVIKGTEVVCKNGVTVHVTGDSAAGPLRLGRIETACADCCAASADGLQPVWSELTGVPTSWRIKEVL